MIDSRGEMKAAGRRQEDGRLADGPRRVVLRHPVMTVIPLQETSDLFFSSGAPAGQDDVRSGSGVLSSIARARASMARACALIIIS